MPRLDLGALIEHIYDAALNDISWGGLLEILTRTFGGAAAVLVDRDDLITGRLEQGGTIIGYTQKQIEDFTRDFQHLDMRMQAVIAGDAGDVYIDDRNLSFADIAISRLHNEFYRPAGVGHASAVVLARQPGQLSILGLHRAIEQGAYQPEEAAALDRIAPHLVRAWSIRRRFAQAEAVAAGVTLALDHFGMPVFLVDGSLQVRKLNAAADVLVRAERALKIRGGRLHAAQAASDHALGRTVAVALEGMAPPILHLPCGAASQVAVMVTSVQRAFLAGGKLALIFANNSETMQPIMNQTIVQQFGLTLAEARTAAALTEGLTPAEISAQFGVSIETVRTQLKQAMTKCDARSQALLVARLATSLAALQRR